MGKGQKIFLLLIAVYLAAGIIGLVSLFEPQEKPAASPQTSSASGNVSTVTSEAITDNSDSTPSNSDVADDSTPADTTVDTEDTTPIELFSDCKGNQVYADTAYYFKACQKSGTLRVRSAANSSAKIVSHLKKNASGKVLKVGENWTKIKYNGTTGYVSSKYLEFSTSKFKDTSSTSNQKTFTVSRDVTMRSESDRNGDTVGALRAGQQGTILKYDSYWCYVECNGKKGYVSTKYISINN